MIASLTWAMAVQIGLLGQADPLDRALSSLSARAKTFDRKTVTCHIKGYLGDASDDPLDSRRWVFDPTRCREWTYVVSFVRPSYRLEVREVQGSGRHEQFSWHKGVLRAIGGLTSSQPSGVAVNNATAGLLNAEPFLTPLGLHVFEHRADLASLLTEFNVAYESNDEIGGDPCVHLSGRRAKTGTETFDVWLNANRGYVPVQMERVLVLPERKPIEWFYRALEFVDHEGLSLPSTAVMYVRNPNVVDDYSVFKWTLDDISDLKVGETNELVVTFPPNTFVFDSIRNQRWRVGPRGERLDVEPYTEADRAAVSQAVSDAAQRSAVIHDRRGVFKSIVLYAVIITVGVCLVGWWLRRYRIARA